MKLRLNLNYKIIAQSNFFLVEINILLYSLSSGRYIEIMTIMFI